MKKALALLLTVVFLLALPGCGQREKVVLADAVTLKDMQGATVGAQADTFHADAAKQVENGKVITYAAFADMQEALENGEIDGFVAEEPTAKAFVLADESLTYIPLLNNSTGFKVEAAAVSVSAALPKESTLKGQINTVLATITEADKKLLMDQMVTFAAGQEVTTPFGMSVKGEISAEAPVLRVGMECAYKPYNWAEEARRQDHGQYIASGQQMGQYAFGYDVEVARYVADKLGMRLEIHAFEWADLVPALEAGVIDAVFAGMSAVEFPEAKLEFTNPYYQSNLVIVTKK